MGIFRMALTESSSYSFFNKPTSQPESIFLSPLLLVLWTDVYKFGDNLSKDIYKF